MSNSTKKYGTISIILFIAYIAFIQIKLHFIIDLIPKDLIFTTSIISIVIAYLLSISGAIFGYLGRKKNVQKKISLLGLILNSLGVISYSSGLINVFFIK